MPVGENIRSERAWRDTWRGYLLAVLVSILTAVVKLGLTQWLGHESPFLVFPAAVLFAAWFGGVGPGLLATVLTAGIANYFYIPPLGSLYVSRGEIEQLLVFVGESLLFCWFAYVVHQTRARLQASHHTLRAELAEREKAEGEVRRSEERYRALVRASAQVVWTSGADGKSDEVARWFTSFTGIERPPDGDPTWWHDALPPEDREAIVATWWTAIREQHPLETEFRLRSADGTYHHLFLRVVPVVEPDGTFREWIGTLADVTDERAAQAALRASEERFRVAQELSLDGFTILSAVRDAGGTIVDFRWDYANPAATNLLRTTPDALVGRRLLEYLPGNRDHSDLFVRYVRVVETGEPHDVEILYAAEGVRGWFRNMAVQLKDGVAVVFRDITARKEAELQMARQNEELERRVAERTRELEQRNSELQSFAFVASHDLQEPLRKVQSFASLVSTDYGDRLDETGRFYVDRIQSAGARMSELLRDVLAYSRVTTRPAPFAPVNVQEITEEVLADLELAIHEHQARVEVEADVWVEADRNQLRQVLNHLLMNAVKFHRDSVPPHIRVSAAVHGQHHEDEKAGTAPQSKALCRIEVADNGIGFEPTYATRIFEPFQRLHGRSAFPGTGMGLAITRRIVERHHGTITAESRPGEGSRFVIVLPVDQAPAGVEV